MNVATTKHGGPSWRSGHREELPPLQHAIANPPPRYSPHGKTFRAVCGAQVATVHDGRAFIGSDPRACAKCKAALR